MKHILALQNSGKTLHTAKHFVGLIIRLRKIIIQDAAAIHVLLDERSSHPLFQLPVFRSSEFTVCTSAKT